MTAPTSSDRPRTAAGFAQAYFRLAPWTVPLYALLLAMFLGGIVILLTGRNPFTAYRALIGGAFGSFPRLATSIGRATPFIGSALAVALAFRAGLFNIGVEGQLLVGALAGAWVGTWAWLAGLPAILTIPLVLVGGVVGGAFWAAIAGYLKAKTGAHEVITTIMLNSIAALLTSWLVTSREPVLLLDTVASVPHTRPIVASARLPEYGTTRLHIGLILMLLLCVLVWFVVERTTLGFEIRTVGINPHAATYAGMSVNRITILVMAASGALAGITGAAEVMGTDGFLQPGVFRNIGFDSIAVALLARANPFAVIPAAFLWGALLAGAGAMQVEAGLAIDLVRIVQALILLFVAADAIVRTLFFIREQRPAGSGALVKEAGV